MKVGEGCRKTLIASNQTLKRQRNYFAPRSLCREIASRDASDATCSWWTSSTALLDFGERKAYFVWHVHTNSSAIQKLQPSTTTAATTSPDISFPNLLS